LKPLGRKPQASRLTVLGESVLFLDSGRFRDGSTPKLNGPPFDTAPERQRRRHFGIDLRLFGSKRAQMMSLGKAFLEVDFEPKTSRNRPYPHPPIVMEPLFQP
jgi:hypothetical protein